MTEIEKYIQKRLFELQDLKFKDFQCKLIPTVNPDSVIGVRTPELRKLAKEICKMSDISNFIDIYPHKYFEENNLHGFLIETVNNFERTIEYIDKFLPYVDNWATCDLVSPKIFKKNLPELFEKIKVWINDDHTYTIRFGIEMLMRFYMDEYFRDEYLDLAAAVKSHEYYVNMMIAWYFATALAKQYEATIPYIENHSLDKWTHNKAIQKAIESYRVDKEHKEYLRTLKIK